MSRIGKLPVAIPQGITLKIEGSTVSVKGPKGDLSMTFSPLLDFKQEDNELVVIRKNEAKETRAMHGLARAKIANMVTGVTAGFEKKMEIRGVGYRIAVAGKKVTLNLGFSHPVEYNLPEKIDVEIDKENKSVFTIRGIDKQVVGEVAAQIRSYRKPEPYKGKGVRYYGEHVPMKQGKAAAGSK